MASPPAWRRAMDPRSSLYPGAARSHVSHDAINGSAQRRSLQGAPYAKPAVAVDLPIVHP